LTILDRVLRHPEALRTLTARDFEGFVAALVEQLGFEDVVLTPRSGDMGRDVLATKRIHGISILCAFECKRYAPDRPVGPEIARALLGTIMHGPTRAAKGILVTTSSFTPAARTFIFTEPGLDGRDFDGIVEWLQEYASHRQRGAT
jgi:restriction system protein